MVLLFSPLLFCILMPLNVNAEVCGGSASQPCNASVVYPNFQNVYLAASSSNITQGLCIRLEFQPNNEARIHYKLDNATEIFEDTATYTFTEVPDVVNITYRSDPNTTHVVQIPFADYDACFIGKFDTALLGCRLWIKDTATSSQITECMNGLSKACPGAVYDTWNEASCANTTKST